MGEAAFPLVAARSRGVGLRLLRDERLATLAAAGNAQAFAVIYERHHAALYRYCRSLLTDPEDARDALQNTMLNAFRALSDGRRDFSLRPWLFRIAHNESISLLRRRRPHAELDEAAEASGPPPDSGLETSERLRQLIVDLRELSEGQRGALVMRELSGLSYPDIGLALGVSPAAAKQQVHAAHTALHEIAEGRVMECDVARESLSVGDRRLVRGRKLSAHLRSCAGCRAFRDGVTSRRADLMALAPPLPVGAAAAIFSGLFGGGGGGAAGGGGLLAGGISGGGAAAAGASGGGGGGFFASVTGGAGVNGGLLAGMAGGGNVAAGSAAAKALVPVAVTIGVGAGGIGLGEESVSSDPAKGERPPAERALSLPVRPSTPLERALAATQAPVENLAVAVDRAAVDAPAALAPAGAAPAASAPVEPDAAPAVPFLSEGSGAEPVVVLEDSTAEPDADGAPASGSWGSGDVGATPDAPQTRLGTPDRANPVADEEEAAATDEDQTAVADSPAAEPDVDDDAPASGGDGAVAEPPSGHDGQAPVHDRTAPEADDASAAPVSP